MKSIFLIILLFVNNSFACMVADPSKEEKSKKEAVFIDPASASGIYAGTVVEGLIRNKFEIDKEWTKRFPNFKLEGTSELCDGPPDYPVGTKYLVLLVHGLKLENFDTANFNNSLIINLKDAQPFIDKLANLKMPKNSINPSWQYCTQDSQCVLEKGICGEEIGINAKYLTSWKSFILNSEKSKFCFIKKFTNRQKNAHKCINNFCGE